MTRPPPANGHDERSLDRRHVPRLWDEPYGHGVYRRRIRLVNDAGRADRTVGELEDDFHHFRIELLHDGATILAANGTGLRGPWDTCMDADAPLRAIEGHPLSASSAAVGRYADARANCTHLFDLTGLAVAHATRPEPVRQYDFEVTDRVGPDQENRATAWRNGEQVLEWSLRMGEIVAPPAWAGVELRRRFIPWAEANLDPDTAEAAIALRRIVDIAIGRVFDLDHLDRASQVGRAMGHGVCHTFREGTAEISVRMRGSGRDFTHHPDALLADQHRRP